MVCPGAIMKTLPQLRLELQQLHASVLAGQRALLEQWQPILKGDGLGADAANLAADIAFRRLRKHNARLLGKSPANRDMEQLATELAARGASPRSKTARQW